MIKQRPAVIPTKIIDDFLEAPQLWRYFALKQEFFVDDVSNFPGKFSKPLQDLNVNLFHSIAGKIIQHLQGYNHFQDLQIAFRLADKSFGEGWIHHDDPKFNVAGLIYLNDTPPENSGTIFYNQIFENLKSYEDYKFQEFSSPPEERYKFNNYKEDQRSYFKKNMTVHNVFNRCVLYSPLLWHSADKFFGDTDQTSRLTLNFFGRAV